MCKLLLVSTTLVLAASIGVAEAQNTPGTPSQTTQSSERGAMMRGMGGEMSEREMGEHSRGGQMMMAHTTAAIFRIRRGDTSIFIKCADNEATQACIAAAATLLDKIPGKPP